METLLYGFEGKKTNLKEKLLNSNKGPVTISDYSHTLYWSIEDYLSKKKFTNLTDKHYADALLQSTKKSFPFPAKVQTWPLWEAFLQKTILCRTTPFEQYNPNGPLFMQSFVMGQFMKKASKAGLQMAIENPNLQIWVSLDKINLNEVLTKEEDWFSTIGSDIRFIYRNWNLLEQKVTFFHNGERIPAPWETNPQKWCSYQHKKHKEEKTQIPKSILKSPNHKKIQKHVSFNLGEKVNNATKIAENSSSKKKLQVTEKENSIIF